MNEQATFMPLANQRPIKFYGRRIPRACGFRGIALGEGRILRSRCVDFRHHVPVLIFNIASFGKTFSGTFLRRKKSV
jgi:hypothetical protein